MHHGKRPIPRLGANPGEIDLRAAGIAALMQAQQHGQTLDTHGKAHTRYRRPAQLLHQTIVTPARRHRALGAEQLGGPLKGSPAVVVQSAHHARIDGKVHLGFGQQALHGGKMFAAERTEAVEDRRRVTGGRNAAGLLAVQGAQRITLDAPLAVAAQRRLALLQECQQAGAILRPALRATEGIDLQRRLDQTQRLEKIMQQQENLSIDIRITPSQRFGADLVKLAHAPLLRPLAAEHRPHVIELAHRLDLVHFRFDIGAHHSGSALRAQCQLGAFAALPRAGIAVFEGVHLLLDDIRGLADGAAEQFGLLDNRNANLGEIIGIENLARLGFDPLPSFHLAGKDIGEAFDAGDFHKRIFERPHKTP